MPKNNNFELEIIRPTKTTKHAVEWIDIQSPTGNFIVGPDNEPLVSILKDRSKIKYKDVQIENIQTFDSYGGVFKVENNKAVFILDL